MSDKDTNYFFGRVDAEIKNTVSSLSELKDEIKEIKKLVLELRNWKYKITGFASGISVVLTLIIQQIFKKIS